MRVNNLRPAVIFAVNRESVEQDLITIQNGLGCGQEIRELEGVYQGESEPSYMMLLEHITLEQVLAFAESQNQESILHLDNQRNAYLIYCNSGMTHYLGEFKQVTKSVALASDAYTYNPQSETYYRAG